MSYHTQKRKITFALIVLALLCLAGCGSNFPATGTSQHQYNNTPAGTGNDPEPGTDGKPKPTPEGHGESILAANGVTYVGSDNGQIYALEAQSGKIRWQHKLNATSLKALVGGVIYATDERSNTGNTIYALNAANGEIIWQKEIKPFINRVKVIDGVVYITTGNAAFPVIIYALQATSGAQLWQYTANGPDLLDVLNGRVYTTPEQDKPDPTNTPQTIAVLNASSAHVLWQLSIASADGSVQGVAEANGMVYLSTNQGAVYAVQAATGQLVWHAGQAANGYPGKSFGITSVAPVLSNGVLYVGSFQSIFAYRASDGKQLWRYSTNSVDGPPVGIQPLVANGVVYLASTPSQGGLVELNATNGEVLWHHSINEIDPGSLVLVNGLLLSQIGDVVAWRTSDGSQVWEHNTDNGQGPPGPGSPVVIDAGVLYIGEQSGTVRAFRVSDGTQLWRFAIPELPVQEPPVYSAWVNFSNTTSYDQALQIVSDLGLKTFADCQFSWALYDGRASFANGHLLTVTANTNSAPLWLDRLKATPAVTQVQPEGPHSCPMERSGPTQRLPKEQAGAYLQVTFASSTAYTKAWESLNALGFRLADPCYEKARAAGQKPGWHPMGEQGSFGSTHILMLATTVFNATTWRQQLQSVPGVTNVAVAPGMSCN